MQHIARKADTMKNKQKIPNKKIWKSLFLEKKLFFT